MKNLLLLFSFLLTCLGCIANKKETDENDKTTVTDTHDAKLETAIIGGGCFWCTEAVFEQIDGVKSVISGYAGGKIPNPTYKQICTGLTGHAEVIKILFDPKVVSYEKILNLFGDDDPTTLTVRDVGTQYRSTIMYLNDAQKEIAIKEVFFNC